MSADQINGLTALTRSVAQRLANEHDRWEKIDHEQSWWDRNGATVLAVAQVGLSVLAFGPCSAFCAAGAAAISTFSAYETCAGNASGLQCAASVGAAAVSIASAGAASAASLADTGFKASASLAGSLMSRATVVTADGTFAMKGLSAYPAVYAYQASDALKAAWVSLDTTSDLLGITSMVHPTTDLWSK
jgi:hypothetical protein